MSAAPRTPLTIRFLGPPQVLLGDTPMAAPRTRKGLWLLALLALRRGRPVERSTLAGLLWPDSPDAHGLYNLRRSLSELRRCLGPAADLLGAPSPRALALNLDGVAFDVLQFEEALRRGAVEEAVELYRGPLLEGCCEEWALAECEELGQLFLSALERAACRAEEGGDPRLAQRYWRRILLADPLRENALAGLLRALRDSGDYAGAMAAYRDFRARLRSELNTEPAAATIRLFESITSDAHPGHRAAWRSTRPAEGWPLFGRERETGEAVHLLAVHRVLQVTGPGGVGKTRLALAVAHGPASEIASSVAFVDLSPLSRDVEVPAAVAQALGVRAAPDEAPVEALARGLARASLLLILDNCEHVESGAASLAGDLLRNCPGVRVLATSRHALGIAGAGRLGLAPLPPPGSTRLFHDRARRALPSYQPSSSDRAAVRSICAALDGLPLAIELAAARVRGLTPVQIAARLDALLPRLEGADFPLPERHLSLRAVMDWSHALLSADEQVLLRRLGVFAGGWTLEAAEAVCAAPPLHAGAIVELLKQLLDRSLVQYRDGRYFLLETIRHYAFGRLAEAGETGLLQRRHGSWGAELAEESREGLLGPAELDWLQRLDREHPNLRAALDAAGPALRLRIAGALWRYWMDRGLLAEARERLEAALAGVEAVSERSARARMGAAAIALFQGRYTEAEQHFRDAEREYRDLEDERGVARSIHNRGRLALERGRYEAARPLFSESLALYQAAGDLTGQAFALGNLATVAVGQGDHVAAESLSLRAERLLRLQGLHQTLGGTLHDRALMAVRRGDLEDARALLQEALEIHLRFGNRLNAARARTSLASVTAALGDLLGAGAHLEGALSEWRDLGNPVGQVQSLWAFAHLAAAAGDPVRAARLLGVWETRRDDAPLTPGFESQHAILERSLQDALGSQALSRVRGELAGLPLECALDLCVQKTPK